MAELVPDIEIPSCKYCGEQFYGEGWWVCKKCGKYVCPECSEKVANEKTGQQNIYYEPSDQEGAEEVGPFCADCFSIEEKTRLSALISTVACGIGALVTSRRIPGLKDIVPDEVLKTDGILSFE